MTANYQLASASGWSAAGIALPKARGLGAMAALRPVTRNLLRGRRWLDALKRSRRAPGGGGGPQPPSEHDPVADSIWDDPELWMLIMIH
jgi:hypothetical protein